MIQLGIRSRSKYPTPIRSVVRNPTPEPWFQMRKKSDVREHHRVGYGAY